MGLVGLREAGAHLQIGILSHFPPGRERPHPLESIYNIYIIEFIAEWYNKQTDQIVFFYHFAYNLNRFDVQKTF